MKGKYVNDERFSALPPPTRTASSGDLGARGEVTVVGIKLEHATTCARGILTWVGKKLVKIEIKQEEYKKNVCSNLLHGGSSR